ncbi:MAG: N-acetyl-gamma-glutamyl-phosphate reductase [Chloroflexi bacterium]|nr:N-acetyl-gamma-glutamyl-phosphate reductase [Chloroflexota bacterium]MYF78354.1 N-acetyl-gamma-glutamyl-phosphate reductase [Chloroflexota bacterium]MYK60813.1 N-acetyl-gamma-glutamyl-phosphate reductase [Chloroflexota bacterium]
MSKTRVGIINVTGYAGSELARILYRHPDVSVEQVTGRSAAGKQLSEVYPHLLDADMTISPSLDDSVDFVFSALPHAASAEALSPFIEEDVRCVDISADFRLKDVNVFETWYKTAHPCPQYIENAVYGLPELHREDVKRSWLIANPGCYPTGTILGLAPAFDANIIETDVISDSKSGVSGAGRKGDVAYNFNEINDNMSAYGLSGHRHMPEMSQELSALSKHGEVKVTFVPHLAPMTRGILGTHYATLKSEVSQEEASDIYRTFYADEPFVRVVSAAPSTKETWGSNHVLINVNVDVYSDRLIVVTALDNLVKGAAGAGVQNMNLMLGLPETTGLETLAVYP